MSFNANIPQGTDPMLKSVNQTRANFQAINTVFAENHIQINDLDNAGKHSSLTFRVQTIDPATSSSQLSLYTKTVSGSPALFFRPNSNQMPIQLTYSSISTGLQSTNPDVYLANQYSFVPGPFVVFSGKITNAVNNQVINLSPATTLIFVSVNGVNDISGNVKKGAIGVPSGASFTLKIPTNAGGSYVYFAIGIP